jgi:arylsulfatase A
MKHPMATMLLLLIAASFGCEGEQEKSVVTADAPLAPPSDSPDPSAPLNLILITVDTTRADALGSYGQRLDTSPNIDRMAREGVRMTNYYVAAPVCTASRAALLTGSYNQRAGNLPILFPDSNHGLNPEERTVAEYLKEAGYATTCIGKWHLVRS